MTRPPRYRILAFLIAAACVALVVVAIFSGDASPWKNRAWQDIDDVSLLSLCWPDSQTAGVPAIVKRYACPQCGTRIDWGSEACPWCGWCPARLMDQAALPCAPLGSFAAGAVADAARKEPAATLVPAAIQTEANAGRQERAAFQAAATVPAGTLPSPRAQGAAGKEFIEGHWLGLEVIPLAPELATEYQVPRGETGVLVDEITLEAAESGILAGDMVQSIDECPASDLRAFFLATQHVQDKERAWVGVSRRGSKMTFVIEARNTKTLGFAQMEAAQPIRPGAISPHRSRGRACTDCHIIMQTGGQLPTDAGDILPNPPPITKDAQAPHRYRGRCFTCHVLRSTPR